MGNKKSNMKIDLLAFGPHPDDVELNIGGILALHAEEKDVVVVDLTRGELASNGTPELRQLESENAAKILNLKERKNLSIPDGGIDPYDLEQQKLVIQVLRYYQPKIVLLPYWEDRHPDHSAASKLIDAAIFKSGLTNLHFSSDLPAYRPERWFYYLQHQHGTPDLIIDISRVYQQKRAAIAAYLSQFNQTERVHTYINQPVFMQKIVARDQYMGALIGVPYGEGLISKSPLLVKNLCKI